jgi:hypothetical protein
MAKEEGRKLARTVHIGGQVWHAGEVPPPEVAEKITNPAAWDAERAAAVGNQPAAADRGGGTVTPTGSGYDTGNSSGLPGGDRGGQPLSAEDAGRAGSTADAAFAAANAFNARVANPADRGIKAEGADQTTEPEGDHALGAEDEKALQEAAAAEEKAAAAEEKAAKARNARRR